MWPAGFENATEFLAAVKAGHLKVSGLDVIMFYHLDAWEPEMFETLFRVCPDIPGFLLCGEVNLDFLRLFMDALSHHKWAAATFLLFRNTLLDEACARIIADCISSGNFPVLKSLEFSKVIIPPESLKLIIDVLPTGNCRMLKNLHFGRVTMSQDCITPIEMAISSGNLPLLENFDLIKIESMGARTSMLKIIVALLSGKCPALKMLDITGDHLGYKEAEAIGALLWSGKCPAMEELEINDNDFNSDAIEFIARGISSGNSPTMTMLGMEKCGIKNGLKYLAEALSEPNTTLVDLDISNNGFHSGNQFDVEIMKGFMQSLKTSSLRVLRMNEGFEYYPEVYTYVGDALAENIPLKNLYMHVHKDMTPKSAEHIFRGLVNNTNLTYLDMRCDREPIDSGMPLKYLVHNWTLQTLHMTTYGPKWYEEEVNKARLARHRKAAEAFARGLHDPASPVYNLPRDHTFVRDVFAYLHPPKLYVNQKDEEYEDD